MTNSPLTGAEFIVRGRVQGVGFRNATRVEALRLRLRGFAHNCADGSVMVQAFGDPLALAELRAWLAHGPRFARVQELRERACVVNEVPDGFSIGDA
jgi:acylphosphatase